MWRLEYTATAHKSIDLLNHKEKLRIQRAIESLQEYPDLGKQLMGPLKGLRSLRTGKYRIIYKKEIHELIILIVAVGLRKNIYK